MTRYADTIEDDAHGEYRPSMFGSGAPSAKLSDREFNDRLAAESRAAIEEECADSLSGARDHLVTVGQIANAHDAGWTQAMLEVIKFCGGKLIDAPNDQSTKTIKQWAEMKVEIRRIDQAIAEKSK